MPTNPSLPIVLLIYANDRIDPANHLRNLSEEKDLIRDALQAAEQAGLCQVLIEANASADRIFSVFQDSRYRNRIAILHYAGHANGYQLLLESASGGRGAANAEGFAAFLGQQRALELVFLNGCSTGQQVQGLLEANCSAVIATSQAIDDRVAMDFASRFYTGLGGGAGIEQAYNEAIAAIQTQTGSDTRALYWGGASAVETTAIRSPWELRIKPGAESARRWNLPDAVGNPLFGLPGLPKLDLPESPFRQLNWFAREHAEVFFGRGFQIRELFQAVTTEGAAPIVLFYGQSGVGKSSVLDAGLLPRLETTYCVHYLRRDQSKGGLLGTLLSAFGDTEATPGETWRKAEDVQGQPVLVVLDQAEEVFTRPIEEQPLELDRFIDGLHDIFGQPAHRPLGRLILGFRKEWLAEIDTRLKEHKLPHNSLFLETLDSRGVIEAITGPTSSARLRDAYKLEIDEGLAKEIADDLLADRESPVAPTLQILLTKLWDRAREKDFAHPKFTRERYHTLKRDGILLGDFLDQQLGALEQWQPSVVQSGLALDVLAYHTTPKGTAAQRTTEELQTRYAHNFEAVGGLIEECKKGYLLADIPSTQLDPMAGTRLAHDTLAPLVRERLDLSEKPSQRARRILDARAWDWSAEKIGAPLDDADLRTVENGLAGGRSWDKTEQRLVDASRAARNNRRKMSNRLRIAGFAAVALIVISAGAAVWYLLQASTQKQLAEERRAIAANSTYAARISVIEKNIAKANFGQAEQDLRDLGSNSLELTSFEWYYLWNRINRNTIELDSGHTNGVVFLRDSDDVITGSAENELIRWNTHTGTRRWSKDAHINGVLRGISALAYCPAKGEVATAGDGDSSIKIWDAEEGKLLRTFAANQGRWQRNVVHTMEFSKSCKELSLLLVPDQRDASGMMTLMYIPWSVAIIDAVEGKNNFSIGGKVDPRSVTISSDGGWLAVGRYRTVDLYDLHTIKKEPTSTIELKRDYAGALAFSPDGRRLAIGGRGVTLWDLSHGVQETYLEAHTEPVTALRFSADGKLLASVGSDSRVRVWSMESLARIDTEIGHLGAIIAIAFSDDSRSLTTGSNDGTTRIWDLDSILPQWITNGSEVIFSPDGNLMMSWDNSYRIGRVVDNSATREVHMVDTTFWAEYAKGRLVLTNAMFSPDGSLLSLRSDDTWQFLDSKTLTMVTSIKTIESSPIGAFSKRTGKFVTLDVQNNLVSVDPRTGNTTQIARLDGDPTALCFVEGGQKIAVADRLRIRLFDAQNASTVTNLETTGTAPQEGSGKSAADQIQFLTPTPNGDYMAVITEHGRASLWDVAAGKEIAFLSQDLDQDHVHALAFAPDSKLLALINSHRRVDIWDIESRKVRTSLVGHVGPIRSVDFSPDGKRIVTGSSDQTVKVWDSLTGRELLSLETNIGPVLTVRFSPRGDAIISTHWQDDYRRVRVWNAASGARIDLESLPRDARVQSYAEAEKLRGQALEAGFSPDWDAAPQGTAQTTPLSRYASLQMLREAIAASRRGDEAQVEIDIRAAHRLEPDIIKDNDGLISRAKLIGIARNREKVDELVRQAHELSDGGAGVEELKQAISLCSQALVLDPLSNEAYFVRGKAYFRSGDKAAAEKDWLRAIELSQSGPFGNRGFLANILANSHYNLACTLSLRSAATQDSNDQQKQVDMAIGHLNNAVRAGLEPLSAIRTDTDLDAIRGDPRFLEILKQIP